MKARIQNLGDAFVIKLKALYDVEKQLTKALPKMVKKSSDPDLKTAFADHLKETEIHVERLEECFQLLDMKPVKLQVDAIRGLVADAEWIIGEKPVPEVLDAMLIGSASHIEHYEISGYVTASKWARILGYAQVTELLEQTLQEEEAAEEKLSDLADAMIDERAMGSRDDDESSADSGD